MLSWDMAKFFLRTSRLVSVLLLFVIGRADTRSSIGLKILMGRSLNKTMHADALSRKGAHGLGSRLL